MSGLASVPEYRAIVLTRLIGSLMLWIDFTLIFSMLSFEFRADPGTVGIAAALYGLPGLLLGPRFGALADRSDPTVVLRCGCAARCLSSVLLMVAGDLRIFVIVVFFKGLANLGAMPAELKLTRAMLSPDQLVSNAGIMTTLDQATKIMAPLLGAALAALSWPAAGFGVSAALSLIGLFCIARIPGQANAPAEANPPREPRKHRRWRDCLHADLRPLATLLRHHRGFRHAFVAATAQTAVLALYDPLLALFLNGQGMPASIFGMIVSATAAGAIVGAIAFRRIHAGHAVTIDYALAAFGLTVLGPGLAAAAGLSMEPVFLLALWVANGCTFAVTMMMFNVTLLKTCPTEAIGTVSATARSAQLAVLVLGPLAGSRLAAWMGIPAVFILAGGVAVAVAIVSACLLRRLRRAGARRVS